MRILKGWIPCSRGNRRLDSLCRTVSSFGRFDCRGNLMVSSSSPYIFICFLTRKHLLGNRLMSRSLFSRIICLYQYRSKYDLFDPVSESDLVWPPMTLCLRFVSKLRSKTMLFWPLGLRKAGRVWCDGTRETHWATCHDRVTPSKTKEFLKSPCFFRYKW